MTLKEKLKRDGNSASWLQDIKNSQAEIASGKSPKVTYYWFLGETHRYAVECYLEGEAQKAKEAAHWVVSVALEYFYGDW